MAPSKVASKKAQASGGKQPGTWTGTCSWRKWTSKRHVIHLLICYTYRYGQSLCFKTVKHRTNGPFNSPRLHVGFMGICIYVYIFIYLNTHDFYTWTDLNQLEGNLYHSKGVCPQGRQSPIQSHLAKTEMCQMGHKISKVGEIMRNWKLEMENSLSLDHFMVVPWLFLTTVFHHRFYQWWRKNGCNSSLFKCTPQKVDNIILHIYIYICIIYIHSYVP